MSDINIANQGIFLHYEILSSLNTMMVSSGEIIRIVHSILQSPLTYIINTETMLILQCNVTKSEV
jgi:hypothetical protein